MSEEEAGDAKAGRKHEILLFLFLTAILIPGLTIVLVGGYGFSIWMYQILAGPPTG
ncbi:periplasmic nitrate reductase, NapE protein [Sneathiella limimaris]|uniref:periplasmic nitrate reductase, NapE protein n=1 Tax=Sneathiella limimaris TaxID=1964213 RepID=UPI00146BBE19|nr:periplasmic nitrate reductase, NapE protein [Sneathiella limimaris]